MNVNGEMTPCQSPSQKPAGDALWAAAMCAAVFGPAAQPVRSSAATTSSTSIFVLRIVTSRYIVGLPQTVTQRLSSTIL